MMLRPSIFALSVAAMTFAVQGVGNVSIKIIASVDSHIEKVTVKPGSTQQESIEINRDENDSWWYETLPVSYTPAFTNVDVGYAAHWEVTAEGAPTLSGDEGDTITIPATMMESRPNTFLYADCEIRFYAVAKECEVTLNPQGGSGGTASVTATYDAAMPGITTPSRDGYEFGGYYTAEDGGGTQYYTTNGLSAHNWNIPSNTTLYAQWTANEYTVMLDRQEGSGGTASVTTTYGAAMPAITVPSRNGYTFDGYFSGSDRYYNANGSSARNWNIPSNTTLYAKWDAIQCSATFNANGGTGGMTKTQAYGSALTAPTVSRLGYDFAGWSPEVPSTMPLNGGTYDAQWTPKTYTVTLDPYPGSGGTDSVTATYDAAMPAITVPSRNGYTFEGYFSGSVRYYNANGSSAHNWDKDSETTTLSARWSPKTYTVTFETYGGTFKNGWTTSTNYVTGIGLTLPASTDIEYINHTFVGWYDNEAFSPEGRVTSIPSTETGDKTFYAKWEAKTYKVHFDANGGQGRGDQSLSMVNTERLKTIKELNISAQNGYTFSTWNTERDGAGNSYGDGATIYNNLTNAANATVTLYAQWTPNTYEVAFLPNGADGGEMVNQPFVYGVAQNLRPVAFARTGYAFERWSSDTNYNSRTKYYLDCAEVTNLTTESAAVVNLYANWTGVVYTVSFNANGAEGTMGTMPCTYGMPTNLPTCMFEREGYGFKGWTTNGADGVLFNDRARVTNLTATAGADVSLIACWTGVTYAVTLDARDWRGNGLMDDGEGGTASVLTNLYTVGDDWLLPVPTNAKPHLAFVGWRDNWGQMVADGALVPLDSEGVTNLVAVWSDSLAAAVDAPTLQFATFGTSGVSGQPYEDTLPLSADWFAQTNFVCGSTNAVQSGRLPEYMGDEKVYVSWLTTTVQGKGVLSFWWKCDAQPLQTEVNHLADEGRVGDSFRFGLYDSENGFTETARLTNHVDWCCGMFTNLSESAVSVAWAFVYTDSSSVDFNNGGGTGWVDRVTWTPEGSVGTLSFISVSGDERVVSGGNAAYTCTATMSDGSTKQVSPTWSINSPYADINSSGVLTAQGTDVPQAVTIKASYTEGGVTVIATKTVTIAPLNTYTITFDPNGGSGTMDSLTCICDVATNLPACRFTHDGWGFEGWATNRTGNVLFADGASVLNLATEGTVALYACWTGITYAVTLDANGGVLANGSGSPVNELTISVTVGGTWDLPAPTRTDPGFVFVFGGWTNGVGQTVSSGEEVPPSSAVTTRLGAVWTQADPLAVAVEAPELSFETFGTKGTSGKPKEESYDAEWFVQSAIAHGSSSSVQSGQLPENSRDTLVYTSWLTTTVEGKGVLSFWWKCDAKPVVAEDYAVGGWAGDSLRFGLYDSAQGITNEVERITNDVDWRYVAYTNKSDSAVSFAWAFVYADYAWDNGGGTGWVDRVTWTPEGAAAQSTPTHGVPYSWLRTYFSNAGSMSEAQLENLAKGDSPNGKKWPNGDPVKVWQDYWAGTNPNDPNELFHARIAVINEEPSISWWPDLSVTGDPKRVYRVLCSPIPSAGAQWVEWPGPGNSGAATNRFFKVELDWEGSRQK